MRKIKLGKWKSQVPVYADDGITIVSTKEQGEDLLTVLNFLISSKRPEEIPRGLDKFRLFGRLSKAFDKADKSRILELEDSDYTFLKESIEKDTPANWGMNQNILKAVEDFLEAKSEDSKE